MRTIFRDVDAFVLMSMLMVGTRAMICRRINYVVLVLSSVSGVVAYDQIPVVQLQDVLEFLLWFACARWSWLRWNFGAEDMWNGSNKVKFEDSNDPKFSVDSRRMVVDVVRSSTSFVLHTVWHDQIITRGLRHFDGEIRHSSFRSLKWILCLIAC